MLILVVLSAAEER